MIHNFEAIINPTKSQISAIERLNPYSPFNTEAYAAACADMGVLPCIFALKSDSDIEAGCLGFLQNGRLSRRLEIVSAPRLSHSTIFWNGLVSFCRKQGVWDLDIRTYASEVADIPSLQREKSRRQRCEFVLDLDKPDLMAGLSVNHRRNVKRAQKAGLSIRRTQDPEASEQHLRLIEASMIRRKTRGENVEAPGSTDFFRALLKAGAAELFQATNGERILSSILVVRSTHGAYYQSSGTDPEGMQQGASAFLNLETAEALKSEGIRKFNLGGVCANEPGLQDYKAGFGGQPVRSEEASFLMASPFQEKIRTMARLAREAPKYVLAALKVNAKLCGNQAQAYRQYEQTSVRAKGDHIGLVTLFAQVSQEWTAFLAEFNQQAVLLSGLC